MKILNKSKKTIDGVAPMKMADLKEEHATKLKAMYGNDIEIVENNKDSQTLKLEQKNLKATITGLEAKIKDASEYTDELEKLNGELEKRNDEVHATNEKLFADNSDLKLTNKALVESNDKLEKGIAEAKKADKKPPSPPKINK